ncbi:MAG: T9SS type A sorting domain-containing protein, partial [Chitinivibrionales bacterium]|nr:T9SS type A sorting domain-containing protein [Chitinivibrionales bacterium]
QIYNPAARNQPFSVRTANGLIILTSTRKNGFAAKLVRADGCAVFHNEFRESAQINIRHIPAGVYTLVIESASSTVQKKIMVGK